MIDIDKLRFLDLLRSGMWNEKPDLDLFADGKTDWSAIFSMAVRHSAVAWVYDGAVQLPDDLKPSRTAMMKWYSVVVRVEAMNRKLDDGVAALSELYARNGIDSVLLKGQGVASVYPNPSHRQPGDIDVYIGKDNYAKANRLIEEDGAVASHKETAHEKHRNYKWNGLIVENHKEIVKLATKSYNDAWNGFFTRYFDKDCRYLEFDKAKVRLPSDYFNSIYFLLHILQHLLTSGIGLRQVCDWMTVVRCGASGFDYENWKEDIRSLGLERPFSLFAYIAVNFFGLDRSMFPCYDEKMSQTAVALLEDILEGGNFGREWKDEKNLRAPRVIRNISLFKWVLRRYGKIRKIYPVETRNGTLKTIKNGISHNIRLIFKKD